MQHSPHKTPATSKTKATTENQLAAGDPQRASLRQRRPARLGAALDGGGSLQRAAGALGGSELMDLK